MDVQLRPLSVVTVDIADHPSRLHVMEPSLLSIARQSDRRKPLRTSVPHLPLQAGDTTILFPPRVNPSFKAAPAAYRTADSRANKRSVILQIDILADGSLGTVTIKSGTGNSAIDDAAIAYVRGLHWVPASLNGRPVAARLIFGVVVLPLSV